MLKINKIFYIFALSVYHNFMIVLFVIVLLTTGEIFYYINITKSNRLYNYDPNIPQALLHHIEFDCKISNASSNNMLYFSICFTSLRFIYPDIVSLKGLHWTTSGCNRQSTIIVI